jgi:photosystem II stability/assembly factor-like uncharacterized protein
VAKTKMKSKSGRPRAPAKPVQAPLKRQEIKPVPKWFYPLGAVLLLALLAGAAFMLGRDKARSGGEGPAASSGLPATPDYHSLLVAPSDPKHLLLGTHAGLYESTNGGRDWERVALEGQDAMNLARSEDETVWTAGHNVFAKSSDGGINWTDVRPDGLPSLDIHGFAVDPRDRTLWAAVAGEGLYRTDGGVSFELVSKDVGGAVTALAVTPAGRLLAGDMGQGLLTSENGGKDWRIVAQTQIMGLAINPDDPDLVVATGPGILISTDGGGSWKTTLELADGAGPVAWAPSDPKIAYAVGFDRTLYRTSDAGLSWVPVA